MSEPSELERFQRWLQSSLGETENIDNSEERDRRQLQLESAIQLTIQFNDLTEISNDIAPPFAERESPVRIFDKDESVKKQTKGSICNSCEEQVSSDLEFCPTCGEFL